MRININTPVGFSDIGGRAKQEDAIYPQLGKLSTNNRVLVVCDGLGGHDYGEVASNTVASALGEWIETNVSDMTPLTREVVGAAVANAQMLLDDANRQHPSDKPMGTTMAMLVLGVNGVIATHIGDSRIYQVRPSTGTILYRSRDHSLVNDLYRMGRLTREEAEASPKKNILTRAMLPAPAKPSQPDVVLITDVKAGDYFLLCSDGVCGEVKDEKLLSALTRTDTSDQMKLAAIQMLAKDGKDNRTALLVRVENVEREATESLPVETEVEETTESVAEEIAADAPAAAAATAAVPPIPLPETGYVTGNEEVHYDYNKPQKKKNSTAWKRAGLILLTALLAAAGIMAYYHSKKPNVEPNITQPATDTLADPDVSIDSMLPPMPGDTMAVGTDVAVPRAPGIGDVPLPNTESKPSAPSGKYPSGSNVSVPRAPKYSGGNTPPYDPYKDMDNFGSDVPIHDYDPAPNPDADRGVSSRDSEPAAKPTAPPPSARQSSTPPPPRKQQASDDPARSNRNVAVPLPSGRSSNRPIETP